MSTKVNGIDSSRSAPVSAGSAAPRTRDASTGSEGSQGAAESSQDVQITGVANKLAALEQNLLEQPPVDEARVAEVRSAIEEGRYTVNPERIADGILKMEQSLSQLEK